MSSVVNCIPKSKQIEENMKFWLTLILVTGALAQDLDDCKTCEYGVKVFFEHLRSQRGVNFQIATLSRDVCPQMEDWFLCDYEVGKRWAGINHVSLCNFFLIILAKILHTNKQLKVMI